MLSAQASLLETVSNDYLGLPLVTPSASAARASTYFASGAQGLGVGPSFLFGMQPDIFEQMKALARLILDMKTERDSARGWYKTTERVYMIYPEDTYGPIAASAFIRAVRSTIGINVDSNAAGEFSSTIDLAESHPVEASVGTDYRPTLLSLLEKGASIVVLLAEGFDGTFVRSVFEQAREVGLVNENTQWYLNGESAKDGLFTVSNTYHDSQLAYDLRGTLGVRACPPTQGSGSDEIRALTRRWASLPADIYPGAGPGSLTPDGRLDPLLAFAYDAVSALAMGIREEQMTADTWGSTLPGFVTERTEGLWEYGESVRSSTLKAEFVGATGKVEFIGGDTLVSSGAGTAGSGWRGVNGTTFCALNLQAHASLGATFTTMLSWQPEQASDTTGTAPFEAISPFQKNQTYPAGGVAYPFDRPILNGVHFEVIAEEAAVPFSIITGRETENSDYKGIALDLMQELSDRLGFTYNIAVANSSVSPDSVVASVAEGKFDIVASWITITAARMDIVSFSYPYYSSGVSFVYRVEIVDEVSWWKMFQPFEASLWFAVFVATSVVFVLLWVFDGGKNELFITRATPDSANRRQLVKGMGMSTYVTGALLMGQMAHEPYTFEGYILSLGWIFASFILAASFTAELASFLSAEEETVLAFGIDDLRDGSVSHSQVALWQGTTLQAFYEEEIMRCYSETQCSEDFVGDSPVPCYTLNECFALVENGTCKATLVDSATAEYRVANDFCGLDILPDTFNAEQYGLVLPKDSPYLEEFMQAMLVLQEDGTLAAINEPYFDSSRCAYLEAYEEASSASQNLTLVDMGGVFLVLGIFVSVSTLLWVFRRFPSAKTGRKWFFGVRDRQKAKKTASITHHEVPTPRDLDPLARENGEDDLDRNANSWTMLSKTDSIRTSIGQPTTITEESKTVTFSEGSNLVRRPSLSSSSSSRSPPQSGANEDGPVASKWEESKYDNGTGEDGSSLFRRSSSSSSRSPQQNDANEDEPVASKWQEAKYANSMGDEW
eukprot:jgi/Undpi1/9948/HiC_scaffold_28.g12402.m1